MKILNEKITSLLIRTCASSEACFDAVCNELQNMQKIETENSMKQIGQELMGSLLYGGYIAFYDLIKRIQDICMPDKLLYTRYISIALQRKDIDSKFDLAHYLQVNSVFSEYFFEQSKQLNCEQMIEQIKQEFTDEIKENKNSNEVLDAIVQDIKDLYAKKNDLVVPSRKLTNALNPKTKTKRRFGRLLMISAVVITIFSLVYQYIS